MAKYPYRQAGTNFDRTFRNDYNANMADIEADVKEQTTRVNDLITGTEQPSEVVDARGGFTVLRDRLDDSDAQLAETMKVVNIKGFTKQDVLDAIEEIKNSPAKSILHFPDGDYIGSGFSLPSNCTVVFSGKAKIIPDTTSTIFDLTGAEPLSYLALLADGLKGDYQISVSDASSFSAGDWVYIRSQAVLDGANSFNNKTSELRKIEKVDYTNNVLTLNEGLQYDFLIADTAECGKATVVENVQIHNAQINDFGYDQEFSRGIHLKFAANVKIINPMLIGSRAVNGSDVDPRVAIGISNSVNVVIDKAYLNNIGWYGVAFSGASQNISINNSIFEKCRHATSLNWSSSADFYGEPHGIEINHCKSFSSSLSAFDSHDTGKDVTYFMCKAYDSGDNGFQVRNGHTTKLIECYAYRSWWDGVKIHNSTVTQADLVQIKGGEYSFNNRNGINSQAKKCNVDNATIHGNISFGITTQGGIIYKCEFKDNGKPISSKQTGDYPMGHLLIDLCHFIKPSGGSNLIVESTGGGGDDFKKLMLKDNVFEGYDAANLIYTAATEKVKPLMVGNRFGNDLENYNGYATLVNGEVTITSPAIFLNTPTTAYRGYVPKVKLHALNATGTKGSLYVSAISNGSMTIKSTDATDGSTFGWEISY